MPDLSVLRDPAESRRAHLRVLEGDFSSRSAAHIVEGVGPPNAATLRLLYEDDPYADFDVDAHPEDLQGWNSYANVFRDMIEAVRPQRIVEVGVWKGTASIHMAKIARELGLACEIICIDTWLGSPEHILAEHGHERRNSLRMQHGYPQLYYTFLSNVIRNEVSDYIVPLPCTADAAAVILRRLKLHADIVHIDAAHDYDSALRDFHTYWGLMSDRGVLIGDDYLARQDVTRAADEFATRVERPLYALFPKFVIARPPEVKFSIIAR